MDQMKLDEVRDIETAFENAMESCVMCDRVICTIDAPEHGEARWKFVTTISGISVHYDYAPTDMRNALAATLHSIDMANGDAAAGATELRLEL